MYNIDIHSYHIYIDYNKIIELINNKDLRFFKHKKYLLFYLLNYIDTGLYIYTCSWDLSYLKNAYELSKNINNKNFIKYLCYFEYEEDIIEYLSGIKNNNDENKSVIILPYFRNFLDYKLEKSDLIECIKQIILIIYTALFKYNIIYTDLSIDNILIIYKKKRKTFKINNKKYTVNGYNIIFNDFININQVKDSSNISFDIIYQFYTSIVYIMEQLNKNYNIGDFLSFLNEINIYSHNIIHPFKIIDTILYQLNNSIL